MKAFVDITRLAEFDYGPSHPLRMERLRLALGLINSYGLLEGDNVRILELEPASEEDLLSFHDQSYIEALKMADGGVFPDGGLSFGLGTGDNPVFPKLYEYSRMYAGASLTAARAVSGGEAGVSFNMAGGLHHAHAGRASGFCYVNDIVLAIKHLLSTYHRVIYVDVDAHHGDGVQEAFYDSDRVMTVSFHESGLYLFPGSGFPEETGRGEGRGYSLNFPFLPGVDDDLFLDCFREVVGGAVDRFEPEVMVVQLGVDGLFGDPLTHLALTNGFLVRVVRFLMDRDLPLVALGGGGYNVDNVARAWSLAWAVMVGEELPDELPEEYLEARGSGRYSGTLRDPELPREMRASDRVTADAIGIKKHLQSKVLPLIGAGGQE